MSPRPAVVGAREGQRVIYSGDLQGFLIDLNYDWSVLRTLEEGGKIYLPLEFNNGREEKTDGRHCLIFQQEICGL